MAHSSWGQGWPNCNRSNIVTVVRNDGLRLPLHRELAPLVTLLLDLTEAVGYDIRPDWTWGYACLAGETLVATPDGDVPIADLAGTTARLLTRTGGKASRPKWVEAPVRSYGEQPLMRLRLSRHGVEREVHATPDHRWIVEYSRSGREGGGYGQIERTTAELRVGARLAGCRPFPLAARTRPSPLGVAHGLVTGDGTVDAKGNGRLALYGAKNWPLVRFFPPDQPQRTYHDPAHAEPHVLLTGLPAAWKRLPSLDEGSSYLYGWLAGLLAADGRVTAKGGVEICATDEDVLRFAALVCRRMGIGCYGPRVSRKAEEGRTFAIGELTADASRAMYSLRLDPATLDSEFFVIPKHRERWDRAPKSKRPARWKVVAVEATDRCEEVFCAEVPGTEVFALADDLLTGNCRAIAGTNIPSNHSWGTAIDINAPANPRRRPLTTNIPRGVREMWKNNGFRWGGDFTTSVPDPMHFEFTGTVADARATNARLRRFLGITTPPPAPAPGPTAPGEVGRIMELQQLLRVNPDGIIGPVTVAAMSRNMIGWRRDLPGNRNPNLVRWLQRQGRRKGYALAVDGAVGPEVNHLIVVVLGQRDGICGPNCYRAACR
jgi:hypothetical protein